MATSSMTGDNKISPTRHSSTWMTRDRTLSGRPGRRDFGCPGSRASPRGLATDRPMLMLKSGASLAEIGRVYGWAHLAGGRRHRGDGRVGGELLVPNGEDQESPQVPAVVRLQVGVIPDHPLHVGRIEEPLLAQALLGQHVAHVVAQVVAQPR